MNLGVSACVLFAAFSFVFAVIFAIGREKAIMLVSSFSAIPPKKRDRYDQAAICRRQRTEYFIWFLLFAAGAALSHLISRYIAIVFIAAWLVWFLRDGVGDAEKRFAKYRIPGSGPK